MIYTVCLGPVDWLFKGKSMNKGSELGDAIQASFVETKFSQVPVYMLFFLVGCHFRIQFWKVEIRCWRSCWDFPWALPAVTGGCCARC